MSAEAMPSILTEDESERLDSTLKGLGVTGAMRPGRRAACQREIEAIVREACARAMDKLSAADPLCGAVWGICRLGAKRIRGYLPDERGKAVTDKKVLTRFDMRGKGCAARTVGAAHYLWSRLA